MPWTGMSSLKQELERLFGPSGELKLDEFPALGDWAPSINVSETKEALVVKAEVPGLGTGRRDREASRKPSWTGEDDESA